MPNLTTKRGPVNGRAVPYPRTFSILQRAIAESPTRDPEDIARRVMAITDAEEPRWSIRRVRDRLTYDTFLRVVVFAIFVALSTVALLWIVVGA